MAARRFHHRRPVAAWVAIVALLLQGLLPLGQAVSVAQADGGEAPLVICTAYGLQTIPADDSGAPGLPDDSSSYSCPVCQAHSLTLIAPAPAAAPLPAAIRLRGDVLRGVRGLAAWQPGAALPRGPPAHA